MDPVTKESAAFAFRGTVKQKGAANLKAITDTSRTAVVTVDEIVRSPSALAGFVGHDVTVQLAANEQVRNGERGVFYVTGFVFGETLAVQSVGHDSVPAAQLMVAASVRAADGDPTRAFRQTKARERAKRAPVVVTGKVVAVGLADSEPTPVTAAAVTSRRVSEHEPFWREAIVQVQTVHKGAVPSQQVVLRFPGSSDVRWHLSPKFQAGQEGVFSLHTDQVSSRLQFGPAAASMAATATAFTALNSADFQPADHEAEVAAVLSAAAATV
ncbi:hypothetical protein NKI39_15660 [Mesorhizobium sp. M0664]|uniref:hypothetical protein n=1 Tax=Mesorhizobium sp. M0664 TaxID=2956982 RepID=UPI003336C4CD